MRATDHKNHNESFTQHHPAFETLLHDTDWHRQFIVQDRLQKKSLMQTLYPFICLTAVPKGTTGEQSPFVPGTV